MKTHRLPRLITLMALPVGLLLLSADRAHPCADGCTGNCDSLTAIWKMAVETERPGYDARSAEDAGLFIGMKIRDQLRAFGYHKAIVEFYPGAATTEAGLVATFLDGVREHMNYIRDDTVAIDLRQDPPEPFHLMTARDVRERTGADLLVTIKFAGVALRTREFRPDSSEIHLRRVQESALARFRVMMTSLNAQDSSAGPLFIDEIPGGYQTDTLYRTTGGVELVDSVTRLYDHFPGLEPDRKRP